MKKLLLLLTLLCSSLAFSQEYAINLEGAENQFFTFTRISNNVEIERIPASEMVIKRTSFDDKVRIKVWSGRTVLSKTILFSDLADGLNGNAPFASVDELIEWSNTNLAKGGGSGSAEGLSATDVQALIDAADNNIVTGATGKFRVGEEDRPDTPVALVGAISASGRVVNATPQTWNHDISQPNVTLKVSMRDADGRPWPINDIDIGAIDRTVGSAFLDQFYIWNHSGAFILCQVVNYETCEIMFSDNTRPVEYVASELVITAPNANPLFLVRDDIAITTTGTFVDYGITDDRITGQDGDIVHLEYGDFNRDTFVFFDGIARAERNGFSTNDTQLQVLNNTLQIRTVGTGSSGITKIWYKQHINAGVIASPVIQPVILNTDDFIVTALTDDPDFEVGNWADSNNRQRFMSNSFKITANSADVEPLEVITVPEGTTETFYLIGRQHIGVANSPNTSTNGMTLEITNTGGVLSAIVLLPVHHEVITGGYIDASYDDLTNDNGTLASNITQTQVDYLFTLANDADVQNFRLSDIEEALKGGVFEFTDPGTLVHGTSRGGYVVGPFQAEGLTDIELSASAVVNGTGSFAIVTSEPNAANYPILSSAATELNNAVANSVMSVNIVDRLNTGRLENTYEFDFVADTDYWIVLFAGGSSRIDNLGISIGGVGLIDVSAIADQLDVHRLEVQQFGGRFLLDPNELAGWSLAGAFDDTVTNDLGNVGAAPSRVAGGFVFPFDVQLKTLHAEYYNSNAAVEPWGFRVLAQSKLDGDNAVVNTDIFREVVGEGETAVAPRDHQSTVNNIADIDLSASAVIPAGTVIGVGVEAPTANATNYYVNVMAGYISYERVF